MKAGTPNSNGNNFPLRPNSTAVVIMKPQGIASKKLTNKDADRRACNKS